MQKVSMTLPGGLERTRHLNVPEGYTVIAWGHRDGGEDWINGVALTIKPFNDGGAEVMVWLVDKNGEVYPRFSATALSIGGLRAAMDKSVESFKNACLEHGCYHK